MALAVLNLASQARFSPGQVVMTAGVDELVRQGRLNPTPYLRRHLHGDWGDLSDDDRRLNDAALKSGEATWAEVLEARLGTPVEDAKPDPLAEKLKAQAAAKPASSEPSAEEQEAIRKREALEAKVDALNSVREPGEDDGEEEKPAGQGSLLGGAAQAAHVDRPATGRRGVR